MRAIDRLGALLILTTFASGCGVVVLGTVAATSGGGSSGGAVRTTNAVPAVTAATIATQDGIAVGIIVVNVSLQDDDGDNIDLEVSMSAPSFNGGQPVVISGTAAMTSEIVTNLSSSADAQGTSHILLWDSEKTIGRINLPDVTLSVKPTDRFQSSPLTGTSLSASAFTINNNNVPTLSLIKSPTEDDNVIPLIFQVTDIDPSDSLFVTAARFTNLQTGEVRDATPGANSPVRPLANPMVLDPQFALQKDQNLVFEWDSRADIGFGNGSLVLFEIEVTDGSNVIKGQFSPPFFVNNGPFEATQTINTILQSDHAFLTDADNNGTIDVLLAMSNGPEVQIYNHDGSGTFDKKVAAYTVSTSIPGPIAGMDMHQAAGNPIATVFNIDLADSSLGLVSTQIDTAGEYPSPTTLVADNDLQVPLQNLGAPFAGTRLRAKVMNVGDFSATSDGRVDLVVLLRNGNEAFNGTDDDMGNGEGQLILIEQDGNGSLVTPVVPLLPTSLNFGRVATAGIDSIKTQQGDFNVKDADNDQDPDVIVAESGTNLIRLYSKEAGQLTLMDRGSLTASIAGQTLITADFGDYNGDGIQDVFAMTSNGTSTSSLLVFIASSPFNYSASPNHTLTVGRPLDDMRPVNLTFPTIGDQSDDIVIGDVSTTNIGVFVSDAATSSGFLEVSGAPQELSFPAGSQVRSIQLGDVNNDGLLDVVSAAPFSNVPIIRVDKPRLYLDAVPVSIQNSATTIDTGDVLGNDNALECVVVDSATNDVLVLGNDPVLALGLRKVCPFRGNLRVKTTDFVDALNGNASDGKKNDIIYTVPDDNGLFVGVAIIPADSADLDIRSSRSDPFLDTNELNAQHANVAQILSNTIILNGGSRFVKLIKNSTLEEGFQSTFANGLAYGDVGRGDDGSGGPLSAANLPDLIFSPGVGVVGDANNQGLFVMYGRADGSFTNAMQIIGPPGTPGLSGFSDHVNGGFVSIEVADFNGDGRLSIFCLPVDDGLPPDPTGTVRNSLTLLEQQANGIGLTASYDFDPGNVGNGLPMVSVGIIAADFNADNFNDIAIASNLGPTCNIALNNGAAGLRNGGLGATFSKPLELASEARAVQCVVANVDLDGIRDDLVQSSLGIGGVMVYTGNGDGTFGIQRVLRAPEPFWIAAGDLNGDGKDDVITTDRGSGVLRVFIHK